MNAMQALKEKLAELPLTPEVAAALVADRCRSEPQLADRLRKDPRACLEKISGRKLPENLKIVLHDNTDDTWHLPLPSYSEGAHLSEEQMQQISAGEAVLVGIGVAAAAFLVAGGIAVGTAAYTTGGFKGA